MRTGQERLLMYFSGFEITHTTVEMSQSIASFFK